MLYYLLNQILQGTSGPHCIPVGWKPRRILAIGDPLQGAPTRVSLYCLLKLFKDIFTYAAAPYCLLVTIFPYTAKFYPSFFILQVPSSLFPPLSSTLFFCWDQQNAIQWGPDYKWPVEEDFKGNDGNFTAWVIKTKMDEEQAVGNNSAQDRGGLQMSR